VIRGTSESGGSYVDKIMSLLQGTAEEAQIVEPGPMRVRMGMVIAAFPMPRASKG